MICKILVVTTGEDGRKETREITSIQRTDVKQETLGLSLAEGKIILKDLQQFVVESQVSSLLLQKRTCPECGEPRSKGNHTLSLRTVFGHFTEDPLAEEFLRGNIKQGDTLEVHVAREQLAFKVTGARANEPANGSPLRSRG
jgi:hypothetical protein